MWYVASWKIWEDTDNKKLGKPWNRLLHEFLKRKTESLLSATQEQALKTNSIRKMFYKDTSYKCRLCRSHAENVLHIVSSCSMLAQKDYKRRHNKVCLNIQWILRKKYGIKVTERWYERKVWVSYGKQCCENSVGCLDSSG